MKTRSIFDILNKRFATGFIGMKKNFWESLKQDFFDQREFYILITIATVNSTFSKSINPYLHLAILLLISFGFGVLLIREVISLLHDKDLIK